MHCILANHPTGGQAPTLVEAYGYELLADITVGTATTSVDITGLSIGKEDELLLVSDVIANGNLTLQLFANNNTTTTNYYYQYINATNGLLVSGRMNSSVSITAGNTYKSFGFAVIKLTNGGYYVHQSSNCGNFGGGDISLQKVYVSSTFTMTSITQLTFTALTANSIGVGSRFQLYKINSKEAKTWAYS